MENKKSLLAVSALFLLSTGALASIEFQSNADKQKQITNLVNNDTENVLFGGPWCKDRILKRLQMKRGCQHLLPKE